MSDPLRAPFSAVCPDSRGAAVPARGACQRGGDPVRTEGSPYLCRCRCNRPPTGGTLRGPGAGGRWRTAKGQLLSWKRVSTSCEVESSLLLKPLLQLNP
ncbi:Hypothetical predicted protein [Marmota monax]|uniref:Uncharacterized protein n=1 Tax=Marmota monax TaxID=9995 RepID=A0A5E4BIR9_MARMO|nr:Hypothetical predicted protein [Marmota monax]